LLKVRKQFALVLQSMGFHEMPTNQYVENSFWNFDALFTPQKHPARDVQDTFFVGDPEAGTPGDKDIWALVREVHERGSEKAGSIGYQYDWSPEEANKLVFRTHTTAVTSKLLWKVAQEYK
jgi:phenylalanyl-tRNA synthetase alpha chain